MVAIPEKERASLHVGACYALAWRSFAKWWIPLCLLSGVLVVFQVLPQLALEEHVSAVKGTLSELSRAIIAQDLFVLERILTDLQVQLLQLTERLLVFSVYAVPAAALLTVIILGFAIRAVKDDKKGPRHKPGFVLYAAVVHVALAIVKGIAFACFILPGLYIYVKLFFVPLIMLEQGKGPSEAIQISAEMTRGNFWQVLAVVLVNAVVQIAFAITIIGLVPATGFAHTARAAAFHMLYRETETNCTMQATEDVIEPPPIPEGIAE